MCLFAFLKVKKKREKIVFAILSHTTSIRRLLFYFKITQDLERESEYALSVYRHLSIFVEYTTINKDRICVKRPRSDILGDNVKLFSFLWLSNRWKNVNINWLEWLERPSSCRLTIMKFPYS